MRLVRVVALAGTLLLSLLLAGCSDDEQRPTSSDAAAELPEARTEVAGAFWEGRIAVAGGLTANGAASDRVDLYEPAANRWTAGPVLPEPLHHVGMAVAGGRLYVAGGYENRPDGSWEPQSQVVSLGPGEGRWRAEPALIQARGGLAMAAVDGTLVAIGGAVGPQASTVVEVLDAGAGAWRPGPALGQGRDHLAATAAGGRIYAIAGRVTGLDTNLTSVESWAPGEARWRPEPSLRHSRGGTSAATVAGQPCVAGGEEPSGTIASVECLAPGGSWRDAATLEIPRHGLAVVAVADRLHVIGGGPEPGLFVSSAHEVLDTSADR